MGIDTIETNFKSLQQDVINLRNHWNINYTLKCLAALALAVTGAVMIIFIGGTFVPTGIGLMILGGFCFFRQIRDCQQAARTAELANQGIRRLSQEQAY
ncbi:MAG: hypothetical protein COT85_06295 [Chlamydiae bacterium CG10_big_fil_rev_8_21_14_0_10_42_34]|nr:MAG: hypothetical protein COT85_06295 [Chlamydiae bacterium CG10_big_fil_rev_8_21_14_0_10_42_34]